MFLLPSRESLLACRHHCPSPLQDDKSSNGLSSSSASLVDEVEPSSVDTVVAPHSVSQPCTPVKSAIRHKSSKSLIEMSSQSPTLLKSRALSWRSDVIESASTGNLLHTSSSLVNSGELNQATSSMDSAISQTSISPIDTSRASMPPIDHTMSLNREKKGQPIKRKTRFSSLQSQNKHGSPPRVSM